MYDRLKKKTIALIAVIIVCVIAMGASLSYLQQNLSFSNCDQEFSQASEQLPDLLENATDETDQNVVLFDAIYQSKVDSVAFMAKNNAGFEATDAKMSELADLLEVYNLLVVNKDGSIVAKAKDTLANFSSSRFNQLRQVFSGTEAVDPVEITVNNDDWNVRYYAAAIDENTMVVVGEKPEVLDNLMASTSSETTVLKDFTVGENGYVFSVSAKTNLITYHPNENLIGADAQAEGIDAGNLSDGARFQMTLDGTNLYCGTTKVDDTYYVFAVPTSDMANSRAIAVGFILFVFFAVMLTVALYGIFVMRKDMETGADEKQTKVFGRLTYNQTIGKKALILSVVGMLCVLLAAFYMQTLFALSSQSVANSERLDQISATIQANDEAESQLRDEYKNWYLSKCRVAEYAVDANPDIATKDKLYELADVLQIASIYIFDGDGNMTASSTPQKTFVLSNDPEDSSYEFRELLSGRADELVQDLSTDDITGEARQYIGVTTHDEAGYANGFVQIAVRPIRLENLLNSVQIDNVLDTVKVNTEGYAFAINKKDGTIAYHPDEKLIGKTYEEVGLTENQVKDGFSDYIDLNGQSYYANCAEVDDYYLFVAGPEGELMSERGSLTLLAGANALICFIIMFCILTLSTGTLRPQAEGAKRLREQLGRAASSGDGRSIDVTLADGTVKTSESAVSRWLNRSFSWHEKSPEQKLGTVLKGLGGILAFVICFAMVFENQVFDEGSVFDYILGGSWEHGWNIFAITASIMYACAAITVAAVIKWLLHLLADVLGARGETVCRLLSSVVEYGMIIFMLYWCLGVLGVDTTTLLASAGIITLAVSFGAKDLITDILSGLFIIFEGEFRVGDVIQVDGVTGTVMDIGVRTTKIKDGNDDVLVIRNSNISNVTNKTKMNSYASADIVLPLSESLTYVENVLSEGLPKIKHRVPEIVDGPYYKGVVALDAAHMTIRVVAGCAEPDRASLERSLKREMKMLLARHDVARYEVHYEHEDVETETFKERVEQAKADKFNKEQKDAAKELGNEKAE